jgi:hypothetical protein
LRPSNAAQSRHIRNAIAAAAGIAMTMSAADAQPDTGIGVELNSLQQSESACRLALVFTNRLPVTIDALELEAVLFDHEGRAGQFLILKSRPLIPGKIRVHQYDLDDTSCDDIGSMLVNDVTTCDGEGLDPATCLSKLRPSSREDTDLVLTTSDRNGEAGKRTASAPAQE